MIDLETAFEKYSDEYLKFSLIDVDKRMSVRPDIHAFLLLDKILPPTEKAGRMVSFAAYDNISLDVDCDELTKVATEENIRDLTRCGVRYEDDSLQMFV